VGWGGETLARILVLGRTPGKMAARELFATKEPSETGDGLENQGAYILAVSPSLGSLSCGRILLGPVGRKLRPKRGLLHPSSGGQPFSSFAQKTPSLLPFRLEFTKWTVYVASSRSRGEPLLILPQTGPARDKKKICEPSFALWGFPRPGYLAIERPRRPRNQTQR